jgi:HEAT repeat protein
MKTVLLVGISFFTIGISGLAQQSVPNKTGVVVLLTRLQSQSEEERSKAFEALRSSPAALKSPEVRAALLDLLDRENHERDARLLQAQNSPQADKDEAEDEGYAEYYSQVLGVVDSFADWNDPRQACILADASYNDDSAFAAEVAHHATVTLPCLMKKSESAITLERIVTVPMLVEVLEKAKDNLDPTTALAARQIVLGALQDPNEGVRAFTVNALGSYGGKDMIAALRKVAETDSSPEVDGSSIRKAAAEAIAEIQKRTTGRAEPQVHPQR